MGVQRANYEALFEPEEAAITSVAHPSLFPTSSNELDMNHSQLTAFYAYFTKLAEIIIITLSSLLIENLIILLH